jgi:hypothetical protein
MSKLFEFEWYAGKCLKIITKTKGLQPFELRDYQKRYLRHLREDFPGGIVRSIVLKPRQAGFSTLIAGINTHRMATEFHYKVILLADKHDRTNAVHKIYSTFVSNLPDEVKPMITTDNTEEIFFANPNKAERKTRPGLGSGIASETANDPHAGRSETRLGAHLTEAAFYQYPDSIDEGIHNSIPLTAGSFICKESTAFGVTGTGEAFYNLWNAAEAKDSIYRAYFVGWFEIPDYSIPTPPGFILSKSEVEIIKQTPAITNENLAWRRLKLSEYSSGTEKIFTPEERFKQDFPSYPEEAFLSTGRPVFDQAKLKAHINEMTMHPAALIDVKIKKPWLALYPQMLKVFKVPVPGRRYSIGGDVAEGVETGDYSNAPVIDAETQEEVAVFHGHLDPDHFGNVLVDLAEVYNNAIIVPEMNNMGHTTLEAIKKRGYLRVWMRSVVDEVEKSKETLKMGWRTTVSTKQQMISRFVARYRDGDVKIWDVSLLREMMACARESDGNVEITGKDRVAGMCLALMGLDQLYANAVVTDPNKKQQIRFEKKDMFRDVVLSKKKA